VWGRDEVEEHRSRGSLIGEIRRSLDQLLAAVGDPPLPAR
jgi:hypothetical protein